MIEELSCTKPKPSRRVVGSPDNSTSSPGDSPIMQTSCSVTENHPAALMQNGDSNCHQEPVREDLDGDIFLTDNPEVHTQEGGQSGDHSSAERLNTMMSDLDVLQNTNNKLRCVVGADEHSCGLKSSSPCQDIFTDLPARSSYVSKHAKRLEVKCRGLHTANQQLQTSLYNTGRSIKH